MAVQLSKSIFYHIPKTGGTWVRKAIEPISICEIGPINSDFGGIFHCTPLSIHPDNKLLSFTFIRHPYTWYQSLFRHNMKHGWEPKKGFNKAQSDNFKDFVFKSKKNNPGGLTKWYKGYTKNINFIGRYENLQDDLISVLQSAGEDFSEDDIKETKPINVGDLSIHVELTQETKDVIYKSEKETFDIFGYEK